MHAKGVLELRVNPGTQLLDSFPNQEFFLSLPGASKGHSGWYRLLGSFARWEGMPSLSSMPAAKRSAHRSAPEVEAKVKVKKKGAPVESQAIHTHDTEPTHPQNKITKQTLDESFLPGSPFGSFLSGVVLVALRSSSSQSMRDTSSALSGLTGRWRD